MLARGLAAAGALLLMGAAPAGPRVMSISLCTDQLLLALLPPERIASVSYLARDAASPAVAALARRVPANRQSAEEVLRQKPDLVLADAFAEPATRAMLRRLGYPLLEAASPTDFGGIRAVTLQIGKAVGAEPRAQAMVARMDAALAEMRANPAPGAPRLAAWDGSGRLPPKGSLYDAVITAAGARNVRREPVPAGGFRMEALLASRPDYLLHDNLVLATSGRQAELVGHPLVRRLYRDRQIVIAQEQFVCGNPATAEAALALNRALRNRAR